MGGINVVAQKKYSLCAKATELHVFCTASIEMIKPIPHSINQNVFLSNEQIRQIHIISSLTLNALKISDKLGQYQSCQWQDSLHRQVICSYDIDYASLLYIVSPLRKNFEGSQNVKAGECYKIWTLTLQCAELY